MLGFIYFEPTYSVRAALWDEAFFDGKPTSWWRAEVERYEIHSSDKWLSYERRESWYERASARLWPRDDLNIIEYLTEQFEGPRLIRGDADAIPVLQQLRNDPSPKVRRFAEIGLTNAKAMP